MFSHTVIENLPVPRNVRKRRFSSATPPGEVETELFHDSACVALIDSLSEEQCLMHPVVHECIFPFGNFPGVPHHNADPDRLPYHGATSSSSSSPSSSIRGGRGGGGGGGGGNNDDDREQKEAKRDEQLKEDNIRGCNPDSARLWLAVLLFLHRSRFHLVWWIHAESILSLEASILDLLDALDPSGCTSAIAQPGPLAVPVLSTFVEFQEYGTRSVVFVLDHATEETVVYFLSKHAPRWNCHVVVVMDQRFPRASKVLQLCRVNSNFDLPKPHLVSSRRRSDTADFNNNNGRKHNKKGSSTADGKNDNNSNPSGGGNNDISSASSTSVDDDDDDDDDDDSLDSSSNDDFNCTGNSRTKHPHKDLFLLESTRESSRFARWIAQLDDSSSSNNNNALGSTTMFSTSPEELRSLFNTTTNDGGGDQNNSPSTTTRNNNNTLLTSTAASVSAATAATTGNVVLSQPQTTTQGPATTAAAAAALEEYGEARERAERALAERRNMETLQKLCGTSVILQSALNRIRGALKDGLGPKDLVEAFVERNPSAAGRCGLPENTSPYSIEKGVATRKSKKTFLKVVPGFAVTRFGRRRSIAMGGGGGGHRRSTVTLPTALSASASHNHPYGGPNNSSSNPGSRRPTVYLRAGSVTNLMNRKQSIFSDNSLFSKTFSMSSGGEGAEEEGTNFDDDAATSNAGTTNDAIAIAMMGKRRGTGCSSAGGDDANSTFFSGDNDNADETTQKSKTAKQRRSSSSPTARLRGGFADADRRGGGATGDDDFFDPDESLFARAERRVKSAHASFFFDEDATAALCSIACDSAICNLPENCALALLMCITLPCVFPRSIFPPSVSEMWINVGLWIELGRLIWVPQEVITGLNALVGCADLTKLSETPASVLQRNRQHQLQRRASSIRALSSASSAESYNSEAVLQEAMGRLLRLAQPTALEAVFVASSQWLMSIRRASDGAQTAASRVGGAGDGGGGGGGGGGETCPSPGSSSSPLSFTPSPVTGNGSPVAPDGLPWSHQPRSVAQQHGGGGGDNDDEDDRGNKNDNNNASNVTPLFSSSAHEHVATWQRYHKLLADHIQHEARLRIIDSSILATLFSSSSARTTTTSSSAAAAAAAAATATASSGDRLDNDDDDDEITVIRPSAMLLPKCVSEWGLAEITTMRDVAQTLLKSKRMEEVLVVLENVLGVFLKSLVGSGTRSSAAATDAAEDPHDGNLSFASPRTNAPAGAGAGASAGGMSNASPYSSFQHRGTSFFSSAPSASASAAAGPAGGVGGGPASFAFSAASAPPPLGTSITQAAQCASVVCLFKQLAQLYLMYGNASTADTYAKKYARLSLVMLGGREDNPGKGTVTMFLGQFDYMRAQFEERRAELLASSDILSQDLYSGIQHDAISNAQTQARKYTESAYEQMHMAVHKEKFGRLLTGLVGAEMSQYYRVASAASEIGLRDREAVQHATSALKVARETMRVPPSQIEHSKVGTAAAAASRVATCFDQIPTFLLAIAEGRFDKATAMLEKEPYFAYTGLCTEDRFNSGHDLVVPGNGRSKTWEIICAGTRAEKIQSAVFPKPEYYEHLRLYVSCLLPVDLARHHGMDWSGRLRSKRDFKHYYCATSGSSRGGKEETSSSSLLVPVTAAAAAGGSATQLLQQHRRRSLRSSMSLGRASSTSSESAWSLASQSLTNMASMAVAEHPLDACSSQQQQQTNNNNNSATMAAGGSGGSGGVTVTPSKATAAGVMASIGSNPAALQQKLSDDTSYAVGLLRNLVAASDEANEDQHQHHASADSPLDRRASSPTMMLASPTNTLAPVPSFRADATSSSNHNNRHVDSAGGGGQHERPTNIPMYLLPLTLLLATVKPFDGEGLKFLELLLGTGVDVRCCSPHDMRTALHVAFDRSILLFAERLMRCPGADPEYTAPYVYASEREGLSTRAVCKQVPNPRAAPLLYIGPEHSELAELVLNTCGGGGGGGGGGVNHVQEPAAMLLQRHAAFFMSIADGELLMLSAKVQHHASQAQQLRPPRTAAPTTTTTATSTTKQQRRTQKELEGGNEMSPSPSSHHQQQQFSNDNNNPAAATWAKSMLAALGHTKPLMMCTIFHPMTGIVRSSFFDVLKNPDIDVLVRARLCREVLWTDFAATAALISHTANMLMSRVMIEHLWHVAEKATKGGIAGSGGQESNNKLRQRCAVMSIDLGCASLRDAWEPVRDAAVDMSAVVHDSLHRTTSGATTTNASSPQQPSLSASMRMLGANRGVGGGGGAGGGVGGSMRQQLGSLRMTAADRRHYAGSGGSGVLNRTITETTLGGGGGYFLAVDNSSRDDRLDPAARQKRVLSYVEERVMDRLFRALRTNHLIGCAAQLLFCFPELEESLPPNDYDQFRTESGLWVRGVGGNRKLEEFSAAECFMDARWLAYAKP